MYVTSIGGPRGVLAEGAIQDCCVQWVQLGCTGFMPNLESGTGQPGRGDSPPVPGAGPVPGTGCVSFIPSPPPLQRASKPRHVQSRGRLRLALCLRDGPDPRTGHPWTPQDPRIPGCHRIKAQSPQDWVAQSSPQEGWFYKISRAILNTVFMSKALR